MPWGLKVDSWVHKVLKKIPREYAEHIFEVIEKLPTDPYAGDIEKEKSVVNVWRRRVGQYRILYEVNNTYRLVHVFDVQRRTTTTYRKR